MTYLQLVNYVLRLLRESQVVSSTLGTATDYQQIVADFVNLAKKEVEDAWMWQVLKKDLQADGSQGNSVITITNIINNPDFLALDITRMTVLDILTLNSSNTLSVMHQKPYEYVKYLKLIQNPIIEGSPTYYSKILDAATPSQYKMEVFPSLDGSYTFHILAKIPQRDYTKDNSIDTGQDVIMRVPHYPVIWNSYAKALSERGEDGGTQFAEAMGEYNRSLSDAIAIDSANSTDSIIWNVV